MDIPEQFKNPYVIGGAVLIFLIVLYKSQNSGGGVDINSMAQIGASSNVQLSTISQQNAASANQTPVALAQIAADKATADTAALLKAFSDNAGALTSANIADVQSRAAQFNDTTQLNMAQIATTANIQSQQIQAANNEALARINAGVSQAQMNADVNMASINASAANTQAAYAVSGQSAIANTYATTQNVRTLTGGVLGAASMIPMMMAIP